MNSPEVFCQFSHMESVASLKPHPQNANRHPIRQIQMLAEVIKRNGWRSPIVVSELSGFIIKGHARLEAARLMGLHEVPVEVQKYPSKKAELADLVADNKIAELAETDWDVLKAIADDLGKDFDPGMFGLGDDFTFDFADETPDGVDPASVEQQFILSIHCPDEKTLNELFEEFQERGLECRMIT